MEKKQQKNSEKFAQVKQSSKMMDELSQLKILVENPWKLKN